ncbi:MAG: iron-containing redox enzyme family protein [Terricaulis sp.]
MSETLNFVPRSAPRRRGDDDAALQRRLASWNRQRLAIQTPTANWRDLLEADLDMRMAEGAFLERTRLAQAERAAEAPRNPTAFVAWFEALERCGPGQRDPLFPWLARAATLTEMRWFLEQEVAGEAGFDDLVALAQIKAPVQAKLELARNYWDEMGRGNPKGMHGPMLDFMAKALNLKPEIETTLAPALALGNTMIGLATNRRYVYHAIGALGVIELTAPGRATLVAEGLKRLGIPARERHYFDLHAVLDVKHSEAWNREVLHPLVSDNPSCAQYLAEGALMRLQCGAACFDAYRAHLWSGAGTAPPA